MLTLSSQHLAPMCRRAEAGAKGLRAPAAPRAPARAPIVGGLGGLGRGAVRFLLARIARLTHARLALQLPRSEQREQRAVPDAVKGKAKRHQGWASTCLDITRATVSLIALSALTRRSVACMGHGLNPRAAGLRPAPDTAKLPHAI